jgi:hypothetical protein
MQLLHSAKDKNGHFKHLIVSQVFKKFSVIMETKALTQTLVKTCCWLKSGTNLIHFTFYNFSYYDSFQ